MVLIVILPFLLACALWKRRLGSWSETFLSAAVVWGGFLVVLTELLSSRDLITRGALTIGWLIICAITCLTQNMVPLRTDVHPRPTDRLSRFVIAFLSALAGVLAIVALRGPPNSWDAMTYHLPRVLHWIQDHNVDYYPVVFFPVSAGSNWVGGAQQVRQLTMMPGAEYAILNLQVISGGERYSALVQWFAYVGCLIGVWSTAQIIGARPRGCALAALFAGTLPMACFQAVSTQNDLVCAFWVVCFARLMIRIGVGRANVFDVFLCGVSLGLALLTKATAYVYVGPLILGWAILLLTRRNFSDVARLAVVFVVAILLNLPTYCRNYNFNGTLLGHSNVDLPYANASITVGNTVSNLIRNVAVEVAGPSDSESNAVERGARSLHRVLGLDPDDLDSTFPFTPFRLAGLHWTQEDHAPNPQHVLLALLAAITLRRAGWLTWFQVFVVAATFMGFCAYLRWQLFHSRLHLAIFMMAAPCIGIAMDRWKNSLLAIPAITLPLAAIFCIAMNVNHPLLRSRNIFNTDWDTRRFIERLDLLTPFQEVARQIIKANPAEVAIDPGLADDWEYPLEMMVKEQIPNVRFEYVPGPWLVHPATRNHGFDPNLKPCVFVRFDMGIPKIIGDATTASSPG